MGKRTDMTGLGLTAWIYLLDKKIKAVSYTHLDVYKRQDLYYIENWTVSFDIKILFLTFFKGFINKNAY